MPFLTSVRSLLNEKVSVNEALPINALPIGVGALVTTDAYITNNDIKIPDYAKWVNFSGTEDFMVVFFREQLNNFFPLPAVGNPLEMNPAGEGPQAEVNPGLRFIPPGRKRKLSIRGITTAGTVTVSFYR